MNTKSYLANFIANHSDWEALLKSMEVSTQHRDNLAIFSYRAEADFSISEVQEARGIILDLDTLDVVCWPFRKFGNYQESYVDEIDWSSARVQEKIDGSIIKLYFWNGEWRWATNNTIFAETCRISSSSKSFYDLITSAVNYTAIDYTKLNTQYTYIFELVSPENRIVIEYPSTKLYHLGTRDNVTGEEYDIDIGVEKTKTYPITTFDECLEAITKLNVSLDDIAHEGFVVVDKNYHRIKVKTSEYFDVHRKINNHILTQKRCLEYILNEPETVATLKATFPEYSHMFMYYEYKLVELKNVLRASIVKVQAIQEEFAYDRKAVWMAIKDNPYLVFALGFIKIPAEELDMDEIISKMKRTTLFNFIPEYTPIKI